MEADARGRTGITTTNDGNGRSRCVACVPVKDEGVVVKDLLMLPVCAVPGTSREGAGVEDAEHPTAYDDEEEEEEEEDAIDPDDLTYEELTVLGEVAGTVAAGLTEKQLNALNRTQYKEFTRENNHSDPYVESM